MVNIYGLLSSKQNATSFEDLHFSRPVFTWSCLLIIRMGRSVQQWRSSSFPLCSTSDHPGSRLSCVNDAVVAIHGTAVWNGKQRRLETGREGYFERWHLYVKLELAALLCSTSNILTSISGRWPTSFACYFLHTGWCPDKTLSSQSL